MGWIFRFILEIPPWKSLKHAGHKNKGARKKRASTKIQGPGSSDELNTAKGEGNSFKSLECERLTF